MNRDDYRDLMTKLNVVAQEIKNKIPDDKFGQDKMMIFYQIRFISGILRDIDTILDFEENPEKVHIELNKRKGSYGNDTHPTTPTPIK